MSRDWQAGYVNMGGSDAHSGRPMSEPLRETGNQSRESIMLPGKRQWPFSTISLGHQVIGVNTKNIWRWKNPNIRLYLLALQDLNTIIRKDREIEREEGTRSDFINSKLLCSSRENDVYSLNDEFRRGNVLISRMASVWFIQKWLSYFGSNQLMIILNLKKKKWSATELQIIRFGSKHCKVVLPIPLTIWIREGEIPTLKDRFCRFHGSKPQSAPPVSTSEMLTVSASRGGRAIPQFPRSPHSGHFHHRCPYFSITKRYKGLNPFQQRKIDSLMSFWRWVQTRHRNRNMKNIGAYRYTALVTYYIIL